jgi:gliding motility-associated-like protein
MKTTWYLIVLLIAPYYLFSHTNDSPISPLLSPPPGVDCDVAEKGAAFLMGRWEGIFTQYSCNINDPYPMIVEFDSFDGVNFEGRLLWPTLEDAVTNMDGFILADTVFIFERTQVNGDNIVLNGTYKSQIIDCCTLSGFWRVDELQPSCSDPQSLIDGGRYTIEKAVCTANCEPEIAAVVQTICAGTAFEGYQQSGIYLDTLLNRDGCDSIRQLELLVLPLYKTTHGLDLCIGDSTFFAGRWLYESGTYFDTLITSSGCDSLVELQLDISALEWSCEVQSPTCPGRDDGLIEIFVYNRPQGNLYQLADFSKQTDPLFSNLKSGTYDLNIVADNGCIVDSTLTVPEPNFRLDFSISPTKANIKYGDSVRINIQTSIENPYINWLPNVFLNCNDCAEVIARPQRDMIYTVQLGTSKLCMIQQRVHIKVEPYSLYFIPTAFSPDGDGVNDYFKVYPSDKIKSMKNFMIYNRWGEQIFGAAELSAGDSGWDGTFHGQKMDTGVFLYSVDITLPNEQVERVKGTFSLLGGER